jgi:aspartate/methionine/tyrosine aminotransferase
MQIEPFRLERYFAAYEFKARWMLSSSDAESMSLDELLALDPSVRDSLGSTRLGYSESNGIPEVREAIASTYRTISPEQVLTHTGAQEPIFNLMNSTLAAGDHVVAHFPGYQSFYSVAKAIGCEVSLWKGRPENGWLLDPSELSRLLRPNTKLVILNVPHNPTGYVPTREEQAELVRIVAERGITLLSDEVYRGLEATPELELPAACDLYEKAVSLGVTSKAYGLAGLRVGWIATRDRALYDRMAAYKDYTTICNPVLSERLAAVAVRNRARILGRNRGIVAANLALARSFIEESGGRFNWVEPKGGTMAFPKAADGTDMERFSKSLLEKDGVMLISGAYFDTDPTYFRLGLGRASFAEAFELFRRRITKA